MVNYSETSNYIGWSVCFIMALLVVCNELSIVIMGIKNYISFKELVYLILVFGAKWISRFLKNLIVFRPYILLLIDSDVSSI